ncbi:proteinaceous RNase P 1, chloroplastic/mitochondrial-like isoform X2 [Telopea speciosissima]|uniref:proteinaceous RNase P 1, chloroplastic/mitochondrial-like isoform X2 n=1 Tax=Telopea speciosissima TaxID=54955 RepID=UPI001CC8094C|nr:proteinaceous RNase P 1, chloroplastic/mitochondrial-like isoform X2 [Telopea speciosissima]
MASFTFHNTLQQKELFFVNLCKYPLKPSSCKSCSIFCSPLLMSSISQTLLHRESCSASLVRANVSNMAAKMCSSSSDHAQSTTQTVNSKTHRRRGYCFTTPLRYRDKSVERKHKKRTVSSVVEEKVERVNGKDSYTRKDRDFIREKEMGYWPSSSWRAVDGRAKIKSKKTKINRVVDNNMGENSQKTESSNQAGDEKVDKKSKKIKVDSPEVQLRIKLDMCSKRGDVLAAISLYDSARREGIMLKQYHYTVLLYLCSSAAVGIVRPAKSGSGSRNLKKLDLTTEFSNVNFAESCMNRDTSNGSVNGSNLNFPSSSNRLLIESAEIHGERSDEIELYSNRFLAVADDDSSYHEKEQISHVPSGFVETNHVLLDSCVTSGQDKDELINGREGGSKQEDEIWVSENVKKYALMKGFEIYEKMCLEEIPLNEAALTSVARMALSMGDGDLAFDMVKKMKPLGINPRLRSYGPALLAFCTGGDIEKAFTVEEHMLEHGVYPEEPELRALLQLSVDNGKADKVYYLLHKLRTSVRQVSPSTSELVEKWFKTKTASRIGKRKWDQRLIADAMENGGGGWHGHGWLGKGKWTVLHTSVGDDGVCQGCGEKLATIDLDPTETEIFAKSVASIAANRERNSGFQKFQKWLDYYGPFEAVVDAANVGLLSQRRFLLSKVNAVVNGIRQKLPSKKWPLIVVHNKRITGGKMNEPANRALIEKWKNADALYATPTGSNDDWYWLYAAIKSKCLIVTNDEMRDHIFQLLGNDFFPKWKERHQVHFSFQEGGPEFHMPPSCSVVIQESKKGHWHIPIVSEHKSEKERTWLCITRAKMHVTAQESAISSEDAQTRRSTKLPLLNHGQGDIYYQNPQHKYQKITPTSIFSNCCSVLSEIEAAEKLGGCIIDFQI